MLKSTVCGSEFQTLQKLYRKTSFFGHYDYNVLYTGDKVSRYGNVPHFPALSAY